MSRSARFHHCHFRDLQIAAPLKLEADGVAVRAVKFPRSPDRGPIEASRLPGQSAPSSPNFRDLQIAAPLKLLRDVMAVPLDDDFRDLQIAAPLKHKGR